MQALLSWLESSRSRVLSANDWRIYSAVKFRRLIMCLNGTASTDEVVENRGLSFNTLQQVLACILNYRSM